MKMKVMNKKETKKLLNAVKEQYGTSKLDLDYLFILGKEDKIYIIDKRFGGLDTTNLRVNSVGLYFGKFEDKVVRLSIEGSQIVGPLSKKNVLTLGKKEIGEWIRGNDLIDNTGSNDFALVKYNDDFYGSGKCSKGRILNFVTKSRRIKAAEISQEE